MTKFVACAALLVLAACTHRPSVPLLKLPPAALGTELAATQRLRFHHADQAPEMQALLEVDRDEVRLAALILGETVEKLRWNGTALSETRAPWLPEQISGGRILSDLQLMLWPPDAIRAGLPTACRLDAAPGVRSLVCEGVEVVRIDYVGEPPSMPRASLHNSVHDYDLTVETAAP